jgi:hypothetical protein
MDCLILNVAKKEDYGTICTRKFKNTRRKRNEMYVMRQITRLRYSLQ